mmetsp:Transcript_34945/g.77706  ORF Transcript_34945/g.77706 Transcript_34945/m.77706 type:complete len:117 (-) Transcript_34945:290-640(-)
MSIQVIEHPKHAHSQAPSQLPWGTRACLPTHGHATWASPTATSALLIWSSCRMKIILSYSHTAALGYMPTFLQLLGDSDRSCLAWGLPTAMGPAPASHTLSCCSQLAWVHAHHFNT